MSHIQWAKLLLQHNEATLHTSAANSNAIKSIIFEVIPHPPYSTDLTLSDFWLFEALNKHLKGNHFTCDKVQSTIRNGFLE